MKNQEIEFNESIEIQVEMSMNVVRVFSLELGFRMAVFVFDNSCCWKHLDLVCSSEFQIYLVINSDNSGFYSK